MQRNRAWAACVLAGCLAISMASLCLAQTSGPASRPGGRIGRAAIRSVGGRSASSRPAAAASTRNSSMPASKSAKTIEECHKLYVHGNYASAIDGYRRLSAGNPLAASIGIAECLAIQGQYEKAIEALEAAASAGAADADWHLAMADQLQSLGRYDDALTHAAKAHELRADWAPAILAHGQVLETLGRKAEAIEVYKSMDTVVAGEAYRRDARSLVALGSIMDRYAILNGRRASDQAQNILQNYLQEAYLKVDKEYWPAHLAAGALLLANHRPNQAMDEFKLAGAINARLPDLMVGVGAAALGQWQFEACLLQADAALKINPRHVEALVLKAVCMMQWHKFDQVEAVLQQALKVNPNDLEALSQLAALHIRLEDEDAAKPAIDTINKINPHYAGLPLAVGDWLVAARQFDQAEGYFNKAIEMSPELAEPHAQLGLMYMQTGQEDKAQAQFKQANQIDDFRDDVVNYLKLLDKLLDPSKYLTRQTDHFIVKVAVEDEVLLDLVSQYMEGIYEEIASDYEYHLAGKTIIEIFPTHQDFSVRITGKGWIGTIGACTGNVIALSAPNKLRTGSSGTHNWAVVLRHEYTHAVTFAATGNRIPHWFTEACAVFQQPDRRAFLYVNTLVNATRSGHLMPVKDLDWGFIRPKTPDQRLLAYCQAEWILEYIIDKKGYHPTVANMMKAFRDGQTQAEVFQSVLGMDEAQFDKEFRAWAKEQLAQWRFDPNPRPELKASQAQATTRPNDDTVQAQLALALMDAGQTKPAEDAARKALDINAENKRAMAVLAYALMAGNKLDEAIGVARKLEDLDHASIAAPYVLARCYLQKQSWAQAITSLELFKQRQPLDSFSYDELTKLYTSVGDGIKALPNLLEMHRRTMNDSQYARRIADIYHSSNQDDKALEFYRQATYINPYESSTYEKMATIYLKAKQYPQAVQAARNMCLLDSNSADAWTKAAMVQYRAGKISGDKAVLQQARESAERALKIEPQGQARQILEMVDEAMAP